MAQVADSGALPKVAAVLAQPKHACRSKQTLSCGGAGGGGGRAALGRGELAVAKCLPTVSRLTQRRRWWRRWARCAWSRRCGGSGKLACIPKPTLAAAAQVAEVGALRKVAAVLALAGAMDQRAVLERTAEAGRRRFVRGLVDEVGCPGLARMWLALRHAADRRCGPGKLRRVPGTMRRIPAGPFCPSSV